MKHVVPFLADTNGPYKQLLAAEQTAQSLQAWIQEKKDAIRSIKQQAVDQDLPRNDFYGHIKHLEEDIGEFKRLLEFNEASRLDWREAHMAAWRATVRPLKVVDMPNELLAKIFANFEDVPVPQIQINRSPLDDLPPSPDLTSIQNIRLTCRAFCEVGSEILLPVVTVSFSRSSLRRLEEISTHPTISKSVRLIRFDISPYSSSLSGSELQFRTSASTRLSVLQAIFVNHHARTQREMAENLRMSGYPAEPRTSTINGLSAPQNEEALAIADALKGVPLDGSEARIRDAISQAHKEYQQKYEEQQSLFDSQQVHADIVSSIRQMPSAQEICITDLHGRLRELAPTTKTAWGSRLSPEKYNAMIKGPNPFRELMVRPGACSTPFLAEDGEPPLALLHSLPSMFQAVNQNLTRLAVDIKPPPQIHIETSAEDLQSLRKACHRLKSIKLRIARPYRGVGSMGMSPACFNMIGSLLSAMLGSPYLEELKLSFALGPAYRQSDSATILGHVLESLSGNKLRRVWLSHVSIKIHELQQLLERAPGPIHLEMNSLYLLDGTWAEALDILRGSTDSTSRIVYPLGGEMRNMSEREAQYFRREFRSQHRDGWYSDQRCPGPASFYIQGGNIPNPLVWGSD